MKTKQEITPASATSANKDSLGQNSPRRALCPRCGRAVMRTRNLYIALSRTDNRTYICSECGTSEALEAVFYGRCTPQSEWPILWPEP